MPLTVGCIVTVESNYYRLRVISALVAFASFLAPVFSRNSPEIRPQTMVISFLLAALWLVLAGAVAVRYEWRVLWLALEFPFALCWPLLESWLAWACRFQQDCM